MNTAYNNNVMFDIETLGRKPGCIVLSIGACAFSQYRVEDTFYEAISVESSRAYGLTSDPETEAWWERRSPEAREAAFRDDARGLSAVLHAFSVWLRPYRRSLVWCQGPHFDVSIIEAVFDVCEMPMPWEFWNVRDSRTLYDLTGVQPNRAKGVHHDALQDAMSQAHAAIDALRKIHEMKRIVEDIAVFGTKIGY